MISRAEKLRSIFDYFLKAFVRDHFLIKAFMVNQMAIDEDFMSRKIAQYFFLFLKAFVRDLFLIKAFMVNQMHLRIVGICHTKIFENNLLRQSTGSKLNLLRKIFGVLSKVAILFNQ